ncbi:hypothetical protein [Vibrio mediterranei]|uniref:hypothetical protein n=1 Tax=Vibrio mediterranei TaxID=689 RepID=UPI004068E66A
MFLVKRFEFDVDTAKLELVEAGEISVTFTLSDHAEVYDFDCISELIVDPDEHFSYINGQCSYQDTGGGWRDTYRRRVRPAILKYLKDGESLVDDSEYPHFSITVN